MLKIFFSKLFTKRIVCDKMMRQLTSRLPSITEPQCLELGAPITLEELTQAQNEMDSGRAPGIDGLPAEFYVEFWDLLGQN